MDLHSNVLGKCIVTMPYSEHKENFQVQCVSLSSFKSSSPMSLYSGECSNTSVT